MVRERRFARKPVVEAALRLLLPAAAQFAGGNFLPTPGSHLSKDRANSESEVGQD